MKSDPEAAGAVRRRHDRGAARRTPGTAPSSPACCTRSAPRRQVTVLRIMDADGVVPEGELDTCLTRAESCTSTRTPARSTLSCLSLGLLRRRPRTTCAYTPGLHRSCSQDMAARTSRSSARAATTPRERKFYPAAFAPDPLFGDAGALPPGLGRRAEPGRSHDRPVLQRWRWVTAQATGANVISPVPTTARGRLDGESRTVDARTADPEHHRSRRLLRRLRDMERH